MLVTAVPKSGSDVQGSRSWL